MIRIKGEPKDCKAVEISSLAFKRFLAESKSKGFKHGFWFAAAIFSGTIVLALAALVL